MSITSVYYISCVHSTRYIVTGRYHWMYLPFSGRELQSIRLNGDFIFCIFGNNSNYFQTSEPRRRNKNYLLSRKCVEISILLLCVCAWAHLGNMTAHTHRHSAFIAKKTTRWRRQHRLYAFEVVLCMCARVCVWAHTLLHFVGRKMRALIFFSVSREIQFSKYRVYGTRGRYFVCRFALCRNAHHVLFLPCNVPCHERQKEIFSRNHCVSFVRWLCALPVNYRSDRCEFAIQYTRDGSRIIYIICIAETARVIIFRH